MKKKSSRPTDVDDVARVLAELICGVRRDLDKYHVFCVLRESLVSEGGLCTDNVDELVDLILTATFDPKRDTLH